MKQTETMFLQITDQQAEAEIYKMAPRKAIMDLKELTTMVNRKEISSELYPCNAIKTDLRSLRKYTTRT